MQAKTLQNGKAATTPNAVAHIDAGETPSRRRGAAAKTASPVAAKPKVGTVTANGSASRSRAKAPSSKRVKFIFSMPPVEHDAIVALKHTLSEVVGSKVKKSDIVRASVLLLLSLPDSKIRAALGKISAMNGSDNGRKTRKM